MLKEYYYIFLVECIDVGEMVEKMDVVVFKVVECLNLLEGEKDLGNRFVDYF